MELNFSTSEIEFLKKELDIDAEKIKYFSDEELNNFLVECALIEADEIMEADSKNKKELSERGNTITTIINKLCELMPPNEDDDDEDDDG